MARVYRNVSDAVENVRGALGALAGACDPKAATPYRGIGYAESALQRALILLDGRDNNEDSAAYMDGFTAAAGVFQPALPFEV